MSNLVPYSLNIPHFKQAVKIELTQAPQTLKNIIWAIIYLV